VDQMEQNEDYEKDACAILKRMRFRCTVTSICGLAMRMPFVRSTMPSWHSSVPNQRRRESCVTATPGATALSGQISSIFLTIPTRAQQLRVLLSLLQALPLLTRLRVSFGRMVVKILKVTNTSTSITQRSTQCSSRTP